MGVTTELLSAKLNQATGTGRPQGVDVWAQRLDAALAAIEGSMRNSNDTLDAPGGGVVNVESDRASSPGLDRSVQKLHDKLDALLNEACELRTRLRKSASGEAEGLLSPGTLDDFHRRAATIVEALKRYEQEEMRVILDHAMTDTGRGE